MIDKQKLIKWIEDKKYVYTMDEELLESEEIALCKGAMKILNRLSWEISIGEFDVEEVTHERSEASIKPSAG
ncbi:hypothetical protein QFZ77_002427 [Paenibacillus sp. V4I3]|uniref:hypothetical protein n=1 Tax=Paenibacillus sp. V4I3 TaxID=3042305 RepID=UPI00278290D8|nr:hypothetical protein [Paenibacillus sp. V4I3]MDQ0873768.1 hypothetical protein [Paenibacillus sp. V4I3]